MYLRISAVAEVVPYALVGEANGVAAVQNGDGGAHKVRVDVVLHDLADDHEGDGATLLVGELVGDTRDLLQVIANRLGFDDHDARRDGGIVVYRDAGLVVNLVHGRGHNGLFMCFFFFVHEGVEALWHRVRPPLTFQHAFNDCRNLSLVNEIE